MTPRDPPSPSSSPSASRRSGVALAVLATLAVIVALWWARSFLIPVCAGLMLALLVLPLTAAIQRLVRLRAIASMLTLMVVVVVLGLAGAAFGDQLARVAGRAPEMISLVAQQLAETDPGADSVLKRARAAFRELDRAADRIAGVRPMVLGGNRAKATAAKPAEAAASAADGAPPPVSLSQTATVALRDTAVTGSGVVVKLAGDLTIVLFVAFFVLSGGRPLATRFLDLWAGGTARATARRERAEHAADECVRQIRIYCGVLLVTNSVVGIIVWIAFAFAGLPDAVGWGVTAAVLHVVPYLGMALLTGLGAAETFLAHGSFGAALGMGGFLIVMSTLIGTVVTAWLQGRAAKMNAAAVFIGVVAWGSLWGVWGLLLGPALIVLMKVVAEHSGVGARLARLMEG